MNNEHFKPGDIIFRDEPDERFYLMILKDNGRYNSYDILWLYHSEFKFTGIYVKSANLSYYKVQVLK